MASHGEYNRRGSHKQPLPPARQVLEVRIHSGKTMNSNILYAFRISLSLSRSFAMMRHRNEQIFSQCLKTTRKLSFHI